MDIQAEVEARWGGRGRVVKEETFNKSALVVLEGEVGGLH